MYERFILGSPHNQLRLVALISKLLVSASTVIAYKVHVHHKTDCIYCTKPDFFSLQIYFQGRSRWRGRRRLTILPLGEWLPPTDNVTTLERQGSSVRHASTRKYSTRKYNVHTSIPHRKPALLQLGLTLLTKRYNQNMRNCHHSEPRRTCQQKPGESPTTCQPSLKVLPLEHSWNIPDNLALLIAGSLQGKVQKNIKNVSFGIHTP